MNNKSKLIIFLHFHKAGGTTINKMFNNHNKYPENHNGNPFHLSKIITYWNYNRRQFNYFKNHCINNNVEFICLEWNFFKFFNELNLDNIELITCIRDPYSRFKSNLNHNSQLFYKVKNYKLNYKDWVKETIFWKTKDNVKKFKLNYNKYNYYVKLLNGLGDNPDIEINESHLDNAKNILSKFNTILILEDKSSFNLLNKYNILYDNTKKNVCHEYNTNLIIPSYEEFKKENYYDYKLFEYAKELSENMKIK